ncbi:MAG: hypothetical protein HUJ26_21085 [Planctomycetaceae bacterium]|nr:hypothetical protein [Planctomycetaceae bacterium]
MISKFPALLLITGLAVVLPLSSSCQAQTQTLGDAMMASLERPTESLIPPPISTQLIQSHADTGQIRPASYHEQATHYTGYSEIASSPVLPEGHSNAPVLNSNCTQSCDTCTQGCETGMNHCEEHLSSHQKKKRELRRRTYFNYHKHTKTLYPVTRPYCHPSYGYYETCWRTLQPQPCYHQSVDGVNHSPQMVIPSGNQTLPPAPIAEETVPRKSYD